MNPEVALIQVDLLLISRLIAAALWGFLWAAVLQHTRWGAFLAQDRTWLTVVIGIGIDLVLAFPADWWTVFAVIAASSVGIILRSLSNEKEAASTGYRVLWGMEDAIAMAQNSVNDLTKFIEAGQLSAAQVATLSRILTGLFKLQSNMVSARRLATRPPNNTGKKAQQ